MDGLILSEIINRSVIAWYCVTVIYLARLFLKKISRKYCYFLWLVVFLNLCIPFSLVSAFSLIPQKLMEISVEEKAPEQPKPEMTEDIIAGDEVENMIVFEGGTSYEEEMKERLPEVEVPVKQEVERDSIKLFSKEFCLIWGERIWILGILVLGCYSLWETFRLNQSLKKGKSKVVDGEEYIIIVPNLPSPVLWGFFSPAIYLPQDLEKEEKIYIIAHEKYHRKRKDYLVKPILYMITIVYWFHPLVWLAYHLCCEDMEMSCDEAVLEKAGSNIRKEYAHSLLKYAAKQNGFLLHPLTFGEPSLRSRIESILKYKKKNVYMTVIALALAVAVGAGLLLRPIEENLGTREDDRIEGQSQMWTPEDIVEEKRDEEFGYLWNPTPGLPCDNPSEAGWDMEHIVDVRENFSWMSYIPEEGTEEDTYLLGKTESYTLYGKGDYRYLLLECDGKYAQVRYNYTSNYMTPLELMETDIDRDEKTELAIKFNVKHGTGVSIDTFLLADFGIDSKLYVHQYLEEDFNIDLGAALSFEKKKHGLQAKVNGENAGYFMENMEDMDAFNIATIGSQMHFYYDQIENDIQLSGDIIFMAEDSVSYWINWNDVTATVCWNGEEFYLRDFTSRNRDMEERIIEALKEDYGEENLYDVNLYYDASDMNQETISVTAEILKTKSDREYDRKEIYLKRDCEGVEVYGGWEIQGEGLKEVSEDHVLKEIKAVVEGDRTLTMRAIGKKREDMDLWGLCQIDVYEGSTKIQVIHLKDIIDIDGLDGSVDQGYTECWSKEELLQAKDVNFDGNQDMEIFAWVTNTSIPYYYMLWNRDSGQFEYGFRIQLTEVDYDNQQLIASYRVGAGTYYTDYYRYNEKGDLHLADRQIRDSQGNLINPPEPEWAEITEEQKLGNGQYLADMDWENLKTRITDKEYQAVQKYLPVLEGEDFTWIYRSSEGREPDTYIHDKKRINIEKWIRESYEKNEQQPQKPVIDSFVFADVFQSGQDNICILFRHLGFHWLILHEEDGVIYGIDMPVRWFGGVQKDGLYYSSGGAADAHYKRMTFENGDYTEYEIAHISYDELYQNGEKKSAEELAKWEKDNIKEPAQVYYPKEA